MRPSQEFDAQHSPPFAKRVPGRGKRSTAKVGDYLRLIARGETLEAIGARYGVSHGAVRKKLKSHGLPTCAIDYLRWLHASEPAPECAEDARIKRGEG